MIQVEHASLKVRYATKSGHLVVNRLSYKQLGAQAVSVKGGVNLRNALCMHVWNGKILRNTSLRGIT